MNTEYKELLKMYKDAKCDFCGEKDTPFRLVKDSFNKITKICMSCDINGSRCVK